MLRTTYFTNDNPLKHVKVVDPEVEIDLYGSKHIRLRSPLKTNLQNPLLIEFSQLELNLPFDPPSGLGTRVYASLDEDSNLVKEIVKDHTQLILEDSISIEHFQYNLNQTQPTFSNSKIKNADAVRIQLNPQTNEIILEAWFGDQNFHTVESEGELGLFELKSFDNKFTLEGRTRVLKTGESSPVLFNWFRKDVYSFGSVETYFNLPYGLHPKLIYKIEPKKPNNNVCKLMAYFDLPSDVFVDRYELSDAVKSGKLIGVWGNTDLERAQWDHTLSASALFELPTFGEYELPLHFRYASPNSERVQLGKLPAPKIFYACADTEAPERSDEHIEPYEMLGLHSFFPPNTVFYQMGNSTSLDYRIPAIDDKSEGFISYFTLLVVCLQSVLVLYAVFRGKRKEKME